ncbi:hypothetical protein [Mycolicibacterium thermoresistibile]
MKVYLKALGAALIAGGVSAAIAAAPTAFAEPNPLLPECEQTGGSSVTGGQTTECASPGNVQIDSTPPDYGYGMFPWDNVFWTL